MPIGQLDETFLDPMMKLDANRISSAFPSRMHYLLAAMGCTFLAIYGSFLPLEYQPIGLAQAIEQFREVRYLDLTVHWRADFVANLLLFIPLGYLWFGVVDKSGWRFVGAIGLVGMLIALAVGIEFAQLWFPRRTVSLNDMIAESVGGCVGVFAAWMVGQWVTDWLGRFFSDRGGAVSWRMSLLHLYVFGLFVYMVLPLDVVVSPEEIRRKVQEGRVVLVPFTGDFGGPLKMLWGVVMDVILYAPVGALATVGWLPKGQIRPFNVAVGVGVLFVAVIEILQLFVFSRFVDSTDVVTGGVGVALGVCIAKWVIRHRSTLVRVDHSIVGMWRVGVVLLAVVLYAIPVLLSFWYPYDWVEDLSVFRERLHVFFDYPFKHYYWGSEYGTMVNLARGFMIFVPVGMVLRWGRGIEGSAGWYWLGLFVVVGLGLVIELGQAMTLTGVPDMTDVFIYGIGGGVGWWVARRLVS